MAAFHKNQIKHNFRQAKLKTKRNYVTSSNKSRKKTILEQYIKVQSQSLETTNRLIQKKLKSYEKK